MKAAARDLYGPPEVVEIRQIERPVPPADGVLVRVRAASVNRADLDNLYPRWFPLDETARALRYLDDGRARGKVVITVT